MKKFSGRGFTLIELLVVIAIIGILASIVLASLDTARKKGRDARRVADLKQIQLALELYYDANGSTYPTQGTLGNVSGIAALLTGGGYISAVPADPNNNATTGYIYQYISTDGAGTTACATANPSCLGYVLTAQLEASNQGYTAITTPTGATATACTLNAATPFHYCVRP